jgi:hypothetical protein
MVAQRSQHAGLVCRKSEAVEPRGGGPRRLQGGSPFAALTAGPGEWTVGEGMGAREAVERFRAAAQVCLV